MDFTPFTQSEIVKMNKRVLIDFFLSIFFEVGTTSKYSKKYNLPLFGVDKKEYRSEFLEKFLNDVKKGTIYYFSVIPKTVPL
jgi:hypothetical protein